jgi:hypothetical protein
MALAEPPSPQIPILGDRIPKVGIFLLDGL